MATLQVQPGRHGISRRLPTPRPSHHLPRGRRPRRASDQIVWRDGGACAMARRVCAVCMRVCVCVCVLRRVCVSYRVSYCVRARRARVSGRGAWVARLWSVERCATGQSMGAAIVGTRASANGVCAISLARGFHSQAARRWPGRTAPAASAKTRPASAQRSREWTFVVFTGSGSGRVARSSRSPFPCERSRKGLSRARTYEPFFPIGPCLLSQTRARESPPVAPLHAGPRSARAVRSRGRPADNVSAHLNFSETC